MRKTRALWGGGVPSPKLYLFAAWKGPQAGERFCLRPGSWDSARLAGLHHQPRWLQPALQPQSSAAVTAWAWEKDGPAPAAAPLRGEAESLATFFCSCGAPSRVRLCGSKTWGSLRSLAPIVSGAGSGMGEGAKEETHSRRPRKTRQPVVRDRAPPPPATRPSPARPPALRRGARAHR